MIKLESAHIEEVRGIRKLDIDFRKGTFAISGPNGSGKSTLAQVLARRESYEVTAGEILFDGKNLLHNQPLRDHRLEFVEDHVDCVDLLALITLNHTLSQVPRLPKFQLAEDSNMLSRNLYLSGARS